VSPGRTLFGSGAHCAVSSATLNKCAAIGATLADPSVRFILHDWDDSDYAHFGATLWLARAVQVWLQSLDDFLDMPDRSRDTWRRVSRMNQIQFRRG
jgi:hypothetical protein